MTDNELMEACFMCECEVCKTYLQPQSNVWLCEPCMADLDSIRAEVVGV